MPEHEQKHSAGWAEGIDDPAERRAKAFEVGAHQPKTHGVDAFRRRGTISLDPEQTEELDVLRNLLISDAGRHEVRKELAARLALIIDMLHTEFIKRVKRNDPEAFDKGPVARMLAYMNALSRIIDRWPPNIDTAKQIEIEKLEEILDEANQSISKSSEPE